MAGGVNSCVLLVLGWRGREQLRQELAAETKTCAVMLGIDRGNVQADAYSAPSHAGLYPARVIS